MMSSVRRLLGIVVLSLLTLGYLASQYAALTGNAPSYSARVDIPQVKYLSLLLFVGALVLAVVPDREDSSE